MSPDDTGGTRPEAGDPLDLAREALVRAKADAAGRAPAAPSRKRRVTPRPTGTPSRGPAPVGGLLREWVTERGVDIDIAVARVLGCWDEVVGPEVAAHSQAERLDEGVLHVTAESTAWATQLRLLSATLLDRVRAEVAAIADPRAAEELVREVRITGPKGPSWKKGRLSAGGRGPRDTYG